MSDQVRAAVVRPQAIATVLDVSVDKIYVDIKSGELRAVRIGRELRILRVEAVTYLEKMGVPIPAEWDAQI